MQKGAEGTLREAHSPDPEKCSVAGAPILDNARPDSYAPDISTVSGAKRLAPALNVRVNVELKIWALGKNF
jgi:hypothetical protein